MPVTYPAPGVKWGTDVGLGHTHVSKFRYTGPASYTTGGEAVAAGAVKLGTIEEILSAVAIAATGAATAIIFAYNSATGKMQAFWAPGAKAALAEVDASTDLSDYAVTMLAIGGA